MLKAREKRKEVLVILIILLIIVLDQLSKIFFVQDRVIIDGILNFTYTQNDGGAFGILGNNTKIIILFNIILLYMIIRFMIVHKERINKRMLVSLILIVSGGISNIIDRIFRGYVVDFIDINPIFSFPIFNIADIILVIGWILLIIDVVISTANIKR